MEKSNFPKSPPLQKEVADKAGVKRTTLYRHQNGVRSNTAVALATCSLCQQSTEANLVDIMADIHGGVSASLIEAVTNIHAPFQDRQHKGYAEGFLLFLFEVQDSGRDVSHIKFYTTTTNNVIKWRMECIIDDLLWQVEACGPDACKMWIGLMPFLGTQKELAVILTAIFNGINE